MNEPIVLAGDFNASPGMLISKNSQFSKIFSFKCRCPKIVFFLSSFIFSCYVGNDVYKKTSEQLKSSYFLCNGCEPVYTTCKVRKNGEACHTIDYIFVSNDIYMY